MKTLRTFLLTLLALGIVGTAHAAQSTPEQCTLTVGPTTVPDGDVKFTYPKIQFTATGSPGPWTFSLFAPNTLPHGMSLTPSGSLSGIPDQQGTYSFGVRATDQNTGCTGGRSYTFTIRCPTPPGIDPFALNGTVNANYHQDLVGNSGTTPYTFALVAGAGDLPPGLHLVTGPDAIDGTPTAEGSYFFSLKVTEANGCSQIIPYKIVISCPTINFTPGSGPLANATVNYQYDSGPISVDATPSSTTKEYDFSTVPALPTGLSLSSTHGSSTSITGTPTGTAPNPVSFTLHAVDAHGCSGDAAYTFNIACPTITFTPAAGALPAATVNFSYNSGPITPSATPNSTVKEYDFAVVPAGGLPGGLSLSSTHGASTSITGIPNGTAPNNAPFSIRATDAHGCSQDVAYTLQINCPTITFTPATGALPVATVNFQYDSGPITPSASPNSTTKDYDFEVVPAGGLPGGLSLSSTHGASTSITGIPNGTAPNNASFSIRATDAHGCSQAVAYTLPISCPTITFTPPAGALPGATVNFQYDSGPITPSATPNSTTKDYDFVVVPAGGLPGGLSLGSTHGPSTSVTGIPNGTAPNNASFSIRATDAHGCSQDVAYTLQISCPTITFTPGPGALPGATVNFQYDSGPITPSASPNSTTKEYDFVVVPAGGLPNGLSLNNTHGPSTSIVGTPVGTAPNPASFSIRATDAHGCSQDVAYTLQIDCPTITFAPVAGPLPAATVNFSYNSGSITPTATPNSTVKEYDFEVVPAGALPTGLSLNNTHGPSTSIVGTPTGSAPNNASFSILATDAHGCSQDVAYTLQINCPTITFAPPAGALPAATVNFSYDSGPITPTATPNSTVKEYDFSVVPAGALPAGLSLNNAHGASTSITGTPTGSAPNNASFSIMAVDAHGCSNSVAYTLQINCPTISFTPGTGALPGAIVNNNYNSGTITPAASPGSGTKDYAFSVVPANGLPDGLSLSSTLGSSTSITGIPTGSAPNNASFSIKAVDPHGCEGTVAYTLQIDCPTITITPAAGPLPDATVNQAYNSGPITPSATPNATAKSYDFSVSSGALPAGLSFNPPSGPSTAITGTPTGSPGTSTFTVKAQDVHGCSVEIQYTITVLCGSVVAVAPTGCITPSPCTLIPVEIHRCNNTSALLFSVTFTLSTEVVLCDPCASGPGGAPGCPSITEGNFLSASGGTTLFEVINNGGGSYTADGSVFPCPPGTQATDATLFTVSVKASGLGGPSGSFTLNSVDVRDCGNNTIPTGKGGPIALTIGSTPPGPPTSLVATQLGRPSNPYVNDGDGTTKVQITFSLPAGATAAKVYRAPFGHTGVNGDYPEYDDVGGVRPVKPTTYPPPSPPWVLTAVTTSGQTDEVPTRGFWYYVAFSVDNCGNVSSASDTSRGVLNYHLGDVANGITDCAGDNKVQTNDFSLLGLHYGITLAHTSDPYSCLDVGPTRNHSTTDLPTTDDKINIEDLAMFTLNATIVSLASDAPRPTGPVPAASNRLKLFVPTTPAIGETFTARLDMSGTGSVHVLGVLLDYDHSVVEPIAVSGGELLSRQATRNLVLSSGPGDVDIATVGAALPGIQGQGEIATVTFRVKAAGVAGVSIKSIDARGSSNEALDLTREETSYQVPAETFLARSFPNPFPIATSIHFGLKAPGLAKLAVFDVAGRVVRSLVNSYQLAGEKMITWDGRGEAGARMSAGVYVIRLEAEGKVLTQRVIMVR